MRKRRQSGCRPCLDQLDDRCLLSGYSPISSSGYTPAQITSAYGLNALTFTSSTGSTVKGDGTGETIALIEMYNDPNIQSDLKTFDAKYGLPNPTLTVVNQAGSQTNSGWAEEESMDVEWAHAIAPGAKILVVEAAPSNSQTQELQNLLNAVNTARNTAGVVAVSMSWGFNEMPNESSYDSYFTTPSGHTGITFIASSGDSGTVEYPSASPNVVSVGGTTLNLSSSGTYGSEAAWFSGGGGYSMFELEPGYQRSVQQTGQRSTPDVAFDADPNTGAEVYSTPPGSSQGSWQVVGGTSLGAPSWAGLIAIVDQGRALAGKGSLDGPTQTLPALYAAPSTSFHSVSSTSSLGGEFPFGVFEGFGGFAYSFGFGFGLGLGFGFGPGQTGSTTTGATANTSTGLGSPNGSALINDLVSSTLTTPLTTSGTSGGSSNGSGSGTAPTNPTQPTEPTKPTKPTKPTGGGTKHPVKHVARTVTVHGRKLAAQGQSTPTKKLTVHIK
jgi:subtilase family serine protease